MSIKGISSAYALHKDDHKVDFSLPQGMAGRTNSYVTYTQHGGLNVRKLTVFFTYKQDDKINLWEGSDSFIKGVITPYITYRPHVNVSIKDIALWLTYRKHDGVDIRKIAPFLLYKQEDKVDSFTIPFGIGGYVNAYALYRIMRLCGFINDFDVTKLQAIVLNNVRFDLKNTSSINKMLIENNNTADSTGG